MGDTKPPVLRLKRGSGPPTLLSVGEPSYDLENRILNIGGSDGIESIGGRGAFVDLGSEQAVTGKKNFASITVSIAPLSANDVVRKAEIDERQIKTIYSATAPENPTTSLRWVDTTTMTALEYIGTAWVEIGEI